MSTKKKFFCQQILTAIGLLGLVLIFIDAYFTSSWTLMVLSFVYSNLIVSLLCSQIILHRYFSHKSFTVNKTIHFLFTALSIIPGQGSPIAWAATHRHHHKHSDDTLDNHSPRESYFLAAGGWLLKGYNWIVVKKRLKTIPTDLLRDKNLIKLDKHYYTIWFTIIIISLIVNYKISLYFLIAPIGWTLMLTALITLGCHIKLPGSYRTYNILDDTYNNMYLQCIVLGDALHNNHHNNSSKFSIREKRYEFDIAGIIINIIKEK